MQYPKELKVVQDYNPCIEAIQNVCPFCCCSVLLQNWRKKNIKLKEFLSVLKSLWSNVWGKVGIKTLNRQQTTYFGFFLELFLNLKGLCFCFMALFSALVNKIKPRFFLLLIIIIRVVANYFCLGKPQYLWSGFDCQVPTTWWNRKPVAITSIPLYSGGAIENLTQSSSL